MVVRSVFPKGESVDMAENKGGRPSKLTPELQDRFCHCVRQGYSLADSARAVGVTRRSLFRWLHRGARQKEGGFVTFCHALRAAQKEAKEIRIKSNPRPIARARYERGETLEQLSERFYLEIMRCIKEGRIPVPAARRGLKLAQDELLDAIVAREDGATANFILQDEEMVEETGEDIEEWL